MIFTLPKFSKASTFFLNFLINVRFPGFLVYSHFLGNLRLSCTYSILSKTFILLKLYKISTLFFKFSQISTLSKFSNIFTFFKLSKISTHLFKFFKIFTLPKFSETSTFSPNFLRLSRFSNFIIFSRFLSYLKFSHMYTKSSKILTLWKFPKPSTFFLSFPRFPRFPNVLTLSSPCFQLYPDFLVSYVFYLQENTNIRLSLLDITSKLVYSNSYTHLLIKVLLPSLREGHSTVNPVTLIPTFCPCLPSLLPVCFYKSTAHVSPITLTNTYKFFYSSSYHSVISHLPLQPSSKYSNCSSSSRILHFSFPQSSKCLWFFISFPNLNLFAPISFFMVRTMIDRVYGSRYPKIRNHS